MKNQKEKVPVQHSHAIATNSYQPSDYQSAEEVDQGLAMTHEQVSDAYVEGTVDGNINEVHGEDFEPQREDFKEYED